MTLIPTTAPRCGGNCTQGRAACDCGIGATAACDLRRVASDNLRREIDGPYRKARKPLMRRIVSLFWSKA